MDDSLVSHAQMVGLMLSWKCSARCRHCAFRCGPHQGRIITPAEGKRVIDCVRSLALTEAVAFSGGEAFLHYDLLLELCRYVKESCGYVFTISTNAFWATSDEVTTRKLGELADLGLRNLLVSVDDFHLEFVDVESVERCVRSAVELGITCHLQTIVTKNSRTVADFQRTLAIPKESPLILWQENPCNPTGRAEDPSLAPELVLGWKNRPECCTMLKTWIIDPYGWVTPCCGVPLGRMLHIGNAFEEPLTDIVNRANVNPLLNAIAAYGGPYLLIDLLATKGHTEYAERSYTSNCHACQSVLRDTEALARIQPELQEHWLELLAGRAIAHNQRYSDGFASGAVDMWLPEPWYRASGVEAKGLK